MIIIQNYNSKHVSPLFQGFLSNDIQKKRAIFILFHFFIMKIFNPNFFYAKDDKL